MAVSLQGTSGNRRGMDRELSCFPFLPSSIHRECFIMALDPVQIIQYADQFHERAQQLESRLRPITEIGQMKGDRWAYDGYGTIEAKEVFGRKQQSNPSDVEFNRRRLSRRRFEATVLVDDIDIAGMLTDPTGKLQNASMHAMERQFDHVVYDAIGASIATGVDFATTVTAAADGVLTVNATAGLTVAKLLEIQQNFIDGEVGSNTQQDIYMGISGDEHTALLGLSQLTSRDFSLQYALEKGTIINAVGINMIKFGDNVVNPILAVAAGVRTSFALVNQAMFVGISQAVKVTVKDRPELIETKQVQVTITFGAVRKEGKLAQLVTTTT